MRPQAILFDVDGTLAETEELHRQAFNRTFQAFGLDWDWDPALYRDLLAVAGGKERLLHYIAAYDPPDAARAQASLAELHAAKTRTYADLITAGEARLRPGVARLMLEAHAAGIPVAIATTTSPENVEALLATAGRDVAHTVAVIAAGDMVPNKKPAPDVYHYALERLGCAAADCVAIEDSAAGAEAALAAGLPTVITRSAFTEPGPVERVLCVLSDLGEPDAPFVRLAGDREGEGMVTLDLLRRWLAD